MTAVERKQLVDDARKLAKLYDPYENWEEFEADMLKLEREPDAKARHEIARQITLRSRNGVIYNMQNPVEKPATKP